MRNVTQIKMFMGSDCSAVLATTEAEKKANEWCLEHDGRYDENSEGSIEVQDVRVEATITPPSSLTWVVIVTVLYVCRRRAESTS